VKGEITLYVAVGVVALLILVVAGSIARVCYVRKLRREGKQYDLINNEPPKTPNNKTRGGNTPEYLPYAL
jgi:hypothetical protein